MPKKPTTWIQEIKNNLEKQGYNTNKPIPTTEFKKQFLLLSGYNKKTINKWTNYFENINLIQIQQNKIKIN